MSYTIVWNDNKTEGIILSGENATDDAKYATTGKSTPGWHSSLAADFYEAYGQYGKCAIQQATEIK